MKVLSNRGGIAATNAWLFADEPSRTAVLFDAPDHTAAPLLDAAEANGWQLAGLWLTHGHFDHLADHALVKSRFHDAAVLIHELDVPKLRVPVSRVFQLPFEIPPGEPDRILQDGDRLKLGDSEVEVIHTPGHSPGHVMFHFPAEKLLVGGDLIIMGAVGRTDLPDSDETALFASIRRVMELPDDTTLLPGHGDPSTLGEERSRNPYVRRALRPA